MFSRPSLARAVWLFVVGAVSGGLALAGRGGGCGPGEPGPAECRTLEDCGLAGEGADDLPYCARSAGDCDGTGLCLPRPDACPSLWEPVCGCDGETYGSACQAARRGVSVMREGACSSPRVVCRERADCPRGFASSAGRSIAGYCAKPLGDCAGDGRCTPRPHSCAVMWAPVCGCDGHTHGNACHAAMAGVAVAYEGECGAPSAPCWADADCPEASNVSGGGVRPLYCARPAGDCGAQGLCSFRPRDCPNLWAPVCGCDGRTHANACEAARAETGVHHEGECGLLPGACHDDADCEGSDPREKVLPGARRYCDHPAGACDEPGICRARPVACKAVTEPVCGCDGVTYDNPCEAAAAGVSVAREGQCPGLQSLCLRNDDCTAAGAVGLYCVKPLGFCGVVGACLPRPTECADYLEPVCACDAHTFWNRCYAAKAGINLLRLGPCLEPW